MSLVRVAVEGGKQAHYAIRPLPTDRYPQPICESFVWGLLLTTGTRGLPLCTRCVALAVRHRTARRTAERSRARRRVAR